MNRLFYYSLQSQKRIRKKITTNKTILAFLFCMLPISWFIDLSWQVIFSAIFLLLLLLLLRLFFYIIPFGWLQFFLCDLIFATNLFGNIQYIFKVFFFTCLCFTVSADGTVFFFFFLCFNGRWNSEKCLNFHYFSMINVCRWSPSFNWFTKCGEEEKKMK